MQAFRNSLLTLMNGKSMNTYSGCRVNAFISLKIFCIFGLRDGKVLKQIMHVAGHHSFIQALVSHLDHVFMYRIL